MTIEDERPYVGIVFRRLAWLSRSNRDDQLTSSHKVVIAKDPVEHAATINRPFRLNHLGGARNPYPYISIQIFQEKQDARLISFSLLV